jgi:hypothetical protein
LQIDISNIRVGLGKLDSGLRRNDGLRLPVETGFASAWENWIPACVGMTV